MADIKVLYVNSDGLDQEHSESSDSIKFLSFKTANKELTDAKLGRLVDGADAADEHIHDARYFRENEFVNSSAGAGDAGKPIILDAAGKLSESMIDIPTLNADLDHDTLIGVAASTAHTAFPLLTGVRPFTGKQSYSSHPSFSADTEIVDKKYVDDLVQGKEWKDSVLTRTATPAGSPSAGDRYLIIATASGAWASKEDQIAEWSGSAWVYTIPTVGTFVAVDDETDGVYLYGGASWEKKFFESTSASGGLTKVGMDIRIAASAAGAALALTAGVLDVQVDDSSIEVNSDALRVKASGIKDTMIDFGTGAGQVSAADMPLADAGNYFGTDNVEAALQYLAQSVEENGAEFTVGIGGVAKGDPVYVSGADTVTKYGSLAGAQRVVGIAASAALAAGTVTVLANDTLVKSVLSGATAGTPYYWSGSAYSSSIPAGGGSHVWELGVAANATDLLVGVKFVKRNA